MIGEDDSRLALPFQVQVLQERKTTKLEQIVTTLTTSEMPICGILEGWVLHFKTGWLVRFQGGIHSSTQTLDL